MSKRAYSVRDIEAKKWVTLPWGEKWSSPFGYPADNARWFISGASASGKSSFVMQLAKELCNYGRVLYMSYEEGGEPKLPKTIRLSPHGRGAGEVPGSDGRHVG